MNAKNIVLKGLFRQPKFYATNKLPTLTTIREFSDLLIDYDLFQKISLYDPSFKPRKTPAYHNVGLNIGKLTDCEIKDSEHLMNMFAFTHAVGRSERSPSTKKSSKLATMLKVQTTSLVKEAILDQIDSEKYKAKICGLLAKTNLDDLTPEVSMLCEWYGQTLTSASGINSNDERHNTDGNACNISESDSNAIKFLTCVDYFLKGLHLHNCMSTEAHQEESKWNRSHQVIKALDIKYPILIGDLFNFRALKMSSTLGAGFTKITQLEERLAKLEYQKKSTRNGTNFGTPEECMTGFYYDVMKGLEDVSNLNEKRDSNSDSATLSTLSKLHPTDSLLSYHLG